MQVTSLSERGGGGGGRQDRRVTFSMIENEGLGMGGQAEWVMVSEKRIPAWSCSYSGLLGVCTKHT